MDGGFKQTHKNMSVVLWELDSEEMHFAQRTRHNSHNASRYYLLSLMQVPRARTTLPSSSSCGSRDLSFGTYVSEARDLRILTCANVGHGLTQSLAHSFTQASLTHAHFLSTLRVINAFAFNTSDTIL